MKRVASAVVALAYCLAFVVVCLGTCLAASDEHGCCEKPQGFTVADAASSTDCCAVTSGVYSNVSTSAHAAAETAQWLPHFVAPSQVVALREPNVLVAPSPPLILRI